MPNKVDLYCAVVFLQRPYTVMLSRGSGDAAMNSKTVCDGKTIMTLYEGGGNGFQYLLRNGSDTASMMSGNGE